MIVALVVVALAADALVLFVTGRVMVDAYGDRAALTGDNRTPALLAAAHGEIVAAWWRVAQALVWVAVSVLMLLYVVPIWPFQTPGISVVVVAILSLVCVGQFALAAAAVAQRSTRNNIVRYVRESGGQGGSGE